MLPLVLSPSKNMKAFRLILWTGLFVVETGLVIKFLLIA